MRVSLFFETVFAVLVLLLSGSGAAAPSARFAIPTVPQCSDVHLHASYLAEEKPGGGTGFLLEIENDRATGIAVPDPAPLSVHWYAQTGGHWLWRASSGSGGSLANALREKGSLFAEAGSSTTGPVALRSIAGHSSYSWTVFAGTNPVLRYRPGCQHCTYQGEAQFHAIVAYAYQPSERMVSESNPTAARLLNCGLRSNPVVMPPLPVASDPHNSTAR